MGKWIPVVAGALLAAYAALGDQLGPVVQANPRLSLILGAVVSLLAYLAKSPMKGK